MSPDAKKKKKLLYVSYYSDYGEGTSIVDIFSVPKYSMVGQITDGISASQGLATDNNGNLYVANLGGNTITVYKPGATSPSLTLTESNGPLDVAVGKNGYVYASDYQGGIDVYAPGATSPIRRLTSPFFPYRVTGVGVDASNNVYATGGSVGSSSSYADPAVVRFAHARGSGTNLGLTGLVFPAGVIIDKNNNLVVSDEGGSEILIYRPRQTSPSGTMTVPSPIRSAINKPENLIYVPESNSNYGVGVYDYPSGTLVTTIPIGGPPTGAALSPAPNH
jgi:sugar lactone lactonase YvrE